MLQRFAAFRDQLLHTQNRTTSPTASIASGTPIRPTLVVGLGNPGPEYENTRHNVGAWCVGLLAKRHDTKFRRNGELNSATIQVQGQTVHLARTRSMVNASGPAVATELRRLGLPNEHLMVVFDDLDLAVGQLRIRNDGGHGGHNGVRSLIGSLSNGKFARVRIGIDRPYHDGRPVRDPERIADWVLSTPESHDRTRIDEIVTRAADAIELATIEGVEATMTKFNQSPE